MNELDLYKFIAEYQLVPEWNEKGKLYLWVPHYLMSDFADLFGDEAFDEGNDFPCFMQQDCICIDLVPVCEEHGIDPERICEKE